MYFLYSFGQDEDIQAQAKKVIPTEEITKTHSIAKAAWLSTVFPGLGQAYNRSYWKMLIIYAGLSTTIYFTADNHKSYRRFLDAFHTRIDSDSVTTDPYVGIYNERQLIEIQNRFRKWRDISIILTVVVYALNILDAYVDAHLHYYNVDDNLSFYMEPAIIKSPYYNFLGLSLKFDI